MSVGPTPDPADGRPAQSLKAFLTRLIWVCLLPVCFWPLTWR